ncbi:MAG: hypothetical protein Q8Q76_07455 [Methylotenera sp.]|nr:hypothetical protein [Methylotenera sp.]
MRIFLLFLLTYANLSHALGIGDIALKSYLGEPLIAKINVTDVVKSPDVGCFSVTDASDTPAFKKANVTLKQNSNGYILNITTPDVITEPIVNLRVSFECEPILKREYVLLLDPVSLLSSAALDASDQPVASNTNISNPYARPLKSQMRLDENINFESYIAPLNQSAKEKRGKKKAHKKNQLKHGTNSDAAIDKKLTLSYTGMQSATSELSAPSVVDIKTSGTKPDVTQAGSTADTSKPYLTISGGDLSPNTPITQPKLSLRLETQIDFNRVETSAPPANSDTMDEITVMANRLAHLEKQIINLQTKNAQLLNEAEQAKQIGFELSEQQSQWLQNILTAIGVLGALAGAEWLRRKSVRNRLSKEQAIWFGSEENADTASEDAYSTANSTNHTKDSAFDDHAFDPLPHHHLSNQNPSDAYSINDETSDSGDNILENADVFIEHGRPALAIQLLQNHLSDFPTESPKTWLKLLNLIVSDGTEAEYNHAVAECKHFFNIKMPSFADATMPDESSIEEFPHIVSRLEGVWGSQFAVGFLSELIYNQYAQPRDGFERGTFEELFFLKQIAETLSANTSKEQDGFYQPTRARPALDNMAFNDAAFGNAKLLNDTSVSDDVTPQNQALTAEVSERASPSNKSTDPIENANAQAAPAYEVGMLVDFDDVSEMQDGAVTEASNLKPNTALEDTAAPKVDQSLQPDSLNFTIPTDALFEASLRLETDSATENLTLTEASDAKKQNETNVIEWDLPKLD